MWPITANSLSRRLYGDRRSVFPLKIAPTAASPNMPSDKVKISGMLHGRVCYWLYMYSHQGALIMTGSTTIALICFKCIRVPRLIST